MGIIKGLSFLSGRIGYKPIPKTACTSIKKAFYELEENRDFSIENVGCDVHQYYEDQFVDISSYEKRVLIIRDPFRSCLLYTSPSPRDRTRSRMPSSA